MPSRDVESVAAPREDVQQVIDLDIFKKKRDFSKGQLDALLSSITDMDGLLEGLPGLTIYAAGSYARLEASPHSDLDLFFVCNEDKKHLPRPNETKFRLFGSLIEAIKTHGFEPFSNDCQYLELIHTEDILEHLGSSKDDEMNYFTARMLLLLESCCLYGQTEYETVKQQMIHSYFADFQRHPEDFQPLFLLNDICRYWKTLLLNYESRRRELRRLLEKPDLDDGESKYLEREWIKNKVRNFKLKHSRMTTCFSSIAIIGSCRDTVTEQYILEATRLTPVDRLRQVADQVPNVGEAVSQLLEGYSWFLEKTELETEELEAKFTDPAGKAEMDEKATQYGELMYELLVKLDYSTPFPLLRHVVI